MSIAPEFAIVQAKWEISFSAGDTVSGKVPNTDDNPEHPSGAQLACAACGHSMSLPVQLLGRQAKCPQCGVLGMVDRPLRELREPDERDVNLEDLAEANAESPGGRPAASPWPEALALDARSRPKTLADHFRNFFAGSLPVNVLSGVLGGANQCLVCLALALLALMVGGAEALAPHALVLTLLPAVLGSALLALNGRLAVSVGGPDPSSALAVFLLLGALGADLAGHANAATLAATLVAALVLATLVSGVLGALLSRLGLADWVRFLPVEALGGMVAGFGLLLAKAWFHVLLAGDASLAALPNLPLAEFGPALVASAPAWGPPLGFALAYVALHLALRSPVWPMLLTALALGGWVLLDRSAASLPVPLATLVQSQARLPQLLNTSCYLGLFDLQILARIDWQALAARQEFFAAVAAVAILPSIARTSILEAVLCRDAGADEQVRVVGAASMLSGLLGGLPSSLSLSGSLGLRALGATGPVSGFVAGLTCLAFLLGGQNVLPHIPRFVPLGLLLATALIMPISWLLRDARNPLTSREDTRVAWACCLMVAFFGPVLGVFLGLGLGLILSLSRAASGGGLRLVQTGDAQRSNVERSAAEGRILKEQGGRILILRLQGFLFLGSLYQVLRVVRERHHSAQPQGLDYVLLDFEAVSGAGASAVYGFRRLEALAREQGLLILLTSAPLEMEERLEALGYRLGGEQGVCHLYLNLDYALEWCEDRLLAEAGAQEQGQAPLEQLLAASFPEPALVPVLVKCLERVEVQKNQRLIVQGDPSDSMFFLQAGKVQVELSLPGGRILRLKKLGPGTVFGEMGLYTSAPRSASVIASERCVAYRLTAERLKLIQAKAPLLAAAVNRFVVALLAERLAEENARNRAAAQR